VRAISFLCATALLASCLWAQSRAVPSSGGLLITVTDENGVAVPEAHVYLSFAGKPAAAQAVTDALGRVRFLHVSAATYQIDVRKVGFYELRQNLQVANPARIRVVLHHVEEYHETVEVNDSPPEIDPTKTESSETLTNREIFSLPYPSSRDFRNVLPFLPSIVQEPSGEIHIAGGSASENFEQLDGFNITHPVTGSLEFRISPDAIRTINVLTSRYSAEYGKATGGVLRLEGKTGDDHFRFSATNFLPGFELMQGFTPSNLTPRVNLSGPIRRGKAWWFEGIGAEYDFNINKDLPFHPNSTPVWRINSLSRVQVNLTSSNVLTADLLINQERSQRVGLAANTPVGSTVDQNQSAYLAGLRDSIALNSHTLLAAGIGLVSFADRSLPRGDLPYLLTPQGVSGSFFETTHSHSRRLQGFARVVRTTSDRKHEFTFGTDVNGINYQQRFQRNPISIIGSARTLVHETIFASPGAFTQRNSEVALYAQDRWSFSKSFLAEYGVRADWDSIIHDWTLEPRFASTYVLDDNKTKFSAGIGLITDQTNLNLLTQSRQGARFDQDFAPDGVTPLAPSRQTAFLTDPAMLRTPRSLTWSISVERMMPFGIYFKTEYQQKRGESGLTFVNISPTFGSSGTYLLSSAERKKYDAISFTVQKKFATNHEVFLSYVRSAARSSAVVPFTLSNPLFGQQAGGPLPWDAPDHVVSWGWLPLTSKFDFAYAVDWRTGFPFLIVNQAQQIVLPADRARFPAFMNLSVHIERRFHFHGREWALRLGVNNVTGRRDPASVNNNIDSPDFLTFSQDQHRALTARIRLIGRK
jgi:hypothetical protein